jgi:hypothetical protein
MTQAPLCGDRIHEATQRKGAEASRLAEMEVAFRRCGVLNGLKWEDEKKEGVAGIMGSPYRNVA